MGKKPLITRSEIRRRKEAEQASLMRNEQLKQKMMNNQETKDTKEKRLDGFYRKELNKNEPLKKSRVQENERSKKMNSFLLRGIMIVIILIVIVAWMVFFL